eukprot:297147_1
MSSVTAHPSQAGASGEAASSSPDKSLGKTVIDEDVILEAVRDEMSGRSEVNAPESTEEEQDEPTDLQSITSLILSFRNIYKIDNLKGFENLVKLQLDNNVISRIENMEHLVKLEWL